MPFITQGKTNWKFLLIVIISAVIVGGGILVWQYLLEVSVKKYSPEERAINLVKSQEFFSFMESYESIRSSDSFKAEFFIIVLTLAKSTLIIPDCKTKSEIP